MLYVKEGRGEDYDPVEVEELIMKALDTPPLKLMREYQRGFTSLATKLRREVAGYRAVKPDPVKSKRHRHRVKRMRKVEVPMSISSGGIDLSKAYEAWYRKKGRKLLMKAFLEDYVKTI